MKNKRQLGRHYRLTALDLLGRLGYGTARQIARGVWGTLTPSTRRMAGRTLNHLLRVKWVVAKRDGASVNGELLYAVTRAGAEQLEYELPKGRPHARDWLRHAHPHRSAANAVFVAARNHTLPNTADGCTELEIRAGDAPSHLSQFDFSVHDVSHSKIPDGIIRADCGLVWIEVENAWRSTKDLNKLVWFMRAMFYQPEPAIAQVWLVVTAQGAKTIGRRLRVALSHPDLRDATPRQLKELDARLLASHIKVWVLDHETLTLFPELMTGHPSNTASHAK